MAKHHKRKHKINRSGVPGLCLGCGKITHLLVRKKAGHQYYVCSIADCGFSCSLEDYEFWELMNAVQGNRNLLVQKVTGRGELWKKRLGQFFRDQMGETYWEFARFFTNDETTPKEQIRAKAFFYSAKAVIRGTRGHEAVMSQLIDVKQNEKHHQIELEGRQELKVNDSSHL